MKKGFICSVCGYVSINGTAPENCPVCGAPKEAFQEKEDAIKTAQDEMELSEKHAPVILVNKDCGFISECVDVHAKVGSTIHPMEKDHYITNIDFYLNDEYLSRVSLTPENLNPAAGLHLKVTEGKVSVVEHCSKHGYWISETKVQT